MSEKIEVIFKGERKDVFTNPMQFPFRVSDYVIVEADKGEDLGLVNQLNPLLIHYRRKNDKPAKQILRKAAPADMTVFEENKAKEEAAFIVGREKIELCSLPMKLVDVEYQFDGKKITFYFTAEKRVDFRELVKELAAEYRVRIELRQIGVRDEAKRISGYGICGRRLCCSAFLKNFEPITTQFAKDQLMPLNPQKLSGVCGRLMCCLNYEREVYLEELKNYPAIESQIKTSRGTGIVEKIDIFKKEIIIRYLNYEWEKFTLEEINQFL